MSNIKLIIKLADILLVYRISTSFIMIFALAYKIRVFCSGPLKENGERLHIKKLTYEVDPSHLNKTTPELMVLSTIELLHLLTLARSERSQNYSLMNSSWKAQEVSEDEMFKKLESAAGKEYQKATKKVFVLENLVGQRLGYVPKRINRQFMEKYMYNIDSCNTKPMIIHQQRRSKQVK
ncbi:hypothetical protein P9304_02755 [Priestia flexa]|uniref:hypothetical protein n=2 Tax=Priestia flexa TaxID=86664 RepID=UPI002E209722|nr:hypothetical protein [Priestia flexa]